MRADSVSWVPSMLQGSAVVAMLALVVVLVMAATFLHGVDDARATGVGILGGGAALGLGIVCAAAVLR